MVWDEENPTFGKVEFKKQLLGCVRWQLHAIALTSDADKIKSSLEFPTQLKLQKKIYYMSILD